MPSLLKSTTLPEQHQITTSDISTIPHIDLLSHPATTRTCVSVCVCVCVCLWVCVCGCVWVCVICPLLAPHRKHDEHLQCNHVTHLIQDQHSKNATSYTDRYYLETSWSRPKPNAFQYDFGLFIGADAIVKILDTVVVVEMRYRKFLQHSNFRWFLIRYENELIV